MMKKDDDYRTAIYARVSSDQQAEEATIESQIAELKERLQKEGCALGEEFCFLDDGYSGETLLRPALERLRDVAFAGALDRIYIHSPDRLARKYAYQVLLVDEFRGCGVDVVFLNRAIGDTPEDNLLLQVQGMIAEYERAKIMERSRRGKRHAARRGSVNVLGGAPYGYRYVCKQEAGGQAYYQVVLEEARVVRQVFDWVGRDGVSMGEVRRRLHAQGTKTQTGKEWWDRSTIWGMLKNTAYIGSAAFGKTRVGERRPQIRPQKGQSIHPRKAYSTYATSLDEQEFIPVPGLVSEALFATVAEQLAENKKRNRQGKRGVKHLLQGLLQCQCCGYAYYGKPVSRSAAKGKIVRYAYYRCIGTDAFRFGGQRICHNKQVRTDLLEEAVWDDVRSLLRDPKRVADEYERRLQRNDEKTKGTSNQLVSQIQKTKRTIARLIDAYEDGLLTKEEFEPRIRNTKQRLGTLEQDAAALAADQAKAEELRLVIGQLQEFSERLADELKEPDWLAKREIIRGLVKRVEVGSDDVRVVYKVSPSPFVQGPASRANLQHCWRRALSVTLESAAGRPGPRARSPWPAVRPLRRRL
jgi:site-specific DNA recombinase